MKKMFFAVLLVFLLVACSSEEKVTNKALPLKNATLQLSAPTASFQSGKNVDSSLLPVYHDHTFDYDLLENKKKAGKMIVKVRELDNGDELVFLQLKGLADKSISTKASLTFKSANRVELMDWDQRALERPHDNTTGVDKVTQPVGLFSLKRFEKLTSELVLSKQYVSSSLEKKYGEGLMSQIRVLEAEKKKYSVSQGEDSVTIQFDLAAGKGKLVEQWFMVSKQPLFSTGQAVQDWVDFQIDKYKETNSWLTVGGPMKKLPWSIEPFSRDGYGRNLGMMVDREAIDRFVATKERYYYNLMVNTAADLYEYRAAKGTPLWETEYTSTWVKKAYGLNAPYVDTRHNEFIALYLAKIGDQLKVPELLDAKLQYGDYLIEQIKIGNVIKAGDGLFISDYFSPYSQKQKTHASMNHVLGGANLLLDCYKQSGDRKYLDAAVRIRKGIEQLDGKWIRETGDLWYQVNPDLTFAGNDYEQLTLVDLLNHQRKWEEVGGGGRSAVIDKLIRSKTEYLLGKQVVLLEEVQRELSEQGFGF
ncbi:hypothetical protein ACFSO7_22515 [Bacillus sp. CGMCC 1.16607]|uniref:hypothetical protein n=1 Tax=Bacillus sp. CGMCC 1.16607 TaxID=3351842 RepID=UPI00362B066E